MITSKHHKRRRIHNLWAVPRGLLVAIVCTLFVPVAHAADPVCARVKIEIQQELTIERQGFDAMMKITNGLDTTTLENVDITVNFKDEPGNSVRATSDPNDTTASFFIRVDTMDGISNVSGLGTVAPSSIAEIHWLIIPAPGAGGTVPTGKLYFVGATLKYTVGGKAEQVDVTPDFIYVKPLPLLNLDYFLTQDVNGDDPLTPEIEPIEPFTLGVRIKNVGAAPAKNVKIDSAQPKIVENIQGLLIGFKIIGSFLNDQPASPSLLIPFGDIPANGSSVGRWQMTSTLMGKFIDFTATFSHADELGGAVTSIIPPDGIKTHLLIRDVKVDLAGRDNVRDFLALDGSVLRVYESSGLDTLVSDLSSYSVLTNSGTNASGEALYGLTSPSSAGLMYVSLPDPFNGSKILSRVTRADGKTIAPENIWISKKRNADHSLSYSINLFDANSPGIYTLALATPPNAPHPPTIQFIPDRTVKEGEQVSFIVDASDPDGTTPMISVTGTLPGGAQFTPQAATNNVAHAAFSWTPATGQAGRYPITFTASDGSLTASVTTVITVTTPTPPPGPDTPVISQPGVATTVNVLEPDLAVAASSNPLDTAVNYEFEIYSDASFSTRIAQNPNVPRTASGATWKVPVTLVDNTNYYWRVRAYDGAVYSAWAVGRFFLNTANDAPSAPAIAAPISGMTVDTPAPTLTVANSEDPDGEAVVYGFEVYTDSTLTQKVAEVNNVIAGANGATSWTVAPLLSDTTPYYWRASATDPHGAKTYSALANFLVDTTKPAPGVPGISAPAVGGVVSTASAALTVTNSTKPVGAVLNYYFELDKDKSFGSLDILRSGAVPEGSNLTAFNVTGLAENTRYYWRAKSGDGLTESAWAYGEFFIDQANDAPTVPVLLNPGNGAFVSTRQPILEISPSVDPENDAIAYHIEIYSDAALSNRVAERLTNNLTWLVEPMLADATTYYWRARAEDLRGGASAWSTTAQFAVRTGQTSRPLLTVVTPSTVVQTSGPTVSINWEIDDPEHASTIALYYDSDNQGEDGTLIANSIAQDPASNVGSYAWNITSLAPGTYYIYAQATNRNGATTRYAPGAFLIPVPQPRGGVTLTPTTALTTTEAGGTAAFRAVLTSSPKSDVTVGFTPTEPNEARVDPQEIKFTAANWSTPQTVTVTGLPDCISDGNQTYQVIAGKAISADPDYNGVQATALTLVNQNSTVGCPSNNPPIANAGPDQTVDAASTVVLAGSGTDSDGAINVYQWTQTAGPTVVIANADKAVANFIAPSSSTGSVLSFELTVTDNQGATGKDSVGVTVRAKPNTAPTANAGTDRTVSSNAAVTLAGSGTDSDGTIASYAWTQIAGPTVVLTGANTATATFTAPVVTASTVLGFTLTVTDNQGATGIASVAITVSPNQAPTANAGNAQTVNDGVVVTLAGSGTDSDGTIASYLWTQTAGPTVSLATPNAASTTFTAPTVTVNTPLTFSLTVTDNNGATGSASVTVTVVHLNGAPVANAGANQTVNEGTVATLSGSGTDSDGTIASYAWAQTAGPTVTLTNANMAVASFTAPQVTADAVLTFQLVVTDNQGATGTATTNVTVKNVNQAPTANAGANQTVNETAAATLTGSGTDADGTIASYAWTQTAGPTVTLTNANTAVASFTAPQVTVDTVLTFQLTVTDNQGATGSATTNITVRNVNGTPVANAGANQSVNEGVAVTLTGSGTDSDGTIASYAWTQTAGPTVTLTNANTAVASFTAPQVTVDTVLTFSLTVTDNQGATGSATTNVTVRNVNAVPIANAGANQAINEGFAVTLSGSGTDADGTIASYAWTQTAGPAVTLTNANTATATFTAPQVTADTVLTFQLTVTDNEGATGNASTEVTVHNVNQVPSANAGANQSVNEGAAVTLSGSGTDADGTIASYLWTQLSGPVVTIVNPNSAIATFTAPQVTGDTVLTFQLTVTDNQGATASATTSVTVRNVNQAPTANAGANQTVNEGAAVTLSGSGTDSDGTIASYAWTQTAGPVVTLTNANTATASFTAPQVTADTVLTFRLTVTDNQGATGSATTNVTVRNVNAAPVANAGAAQTVNEGAAVTLSGSGTDSDGTIASYAWTQTAGPTVTLNNANTATATFTAPQVTADTVLTFRLTVTDNQGATGSATTNVTVRNVATGSDLIVTAVSSSVSQAKLGQSLTVTNTVQNQGSAAITKSFSVRVYLSTDSTITTSDTVLATRTVSSLGAGASNTANTSVTIPTGLTPGTYYIGAIADYTNVIAESNETNNALTGNTIQVVRDVDLIMTAVSTTTTSIARGKTITMTNTVKNQGTNALNGSFSVGLYLSTDGNVTTSDILVGTRTVSSLSAGSTNSASTTVTIPSNISPGTYYIGAIADYANSQAETNEANNTLVGKTITVQ